MENIRNRVDVRLVTNENQARKLISKPSFDKRKIFCDKLAAIHMHRKRLYFNKPVYLGMSILDISKILMYDFHYDYIKEMYGDRAKLGPTDTDSLFYEIQTDDFYKDISGDVLKLFDTSNFPKDHPSGIYNNVNKKVIGMFKDEAGGKQIAEKVGLRSKLYSYILDSYCVEDEGRKFKEGEDHTIEKRCKGVKKSTVDKKVSFQDYKDCLMNGKKEMRATNDKKEEMRATNRKKGMRDMNVIRSRDHKVYTEEVNKLALSWEDDKRHILPNGIDTLALGHYKICRIDEFSEESDSEESIDHEENIEKIIGYDDGVPIFLTKLRPLF